MELVYSRTKTIQEDKVSGFCPGCMHSTVVKLIGEALEEMNLVDKAVMVTGIGCCGLHMDYIAYDTITAWSCLCSSNRYEEKQSGYSVFHISG